MRQVAFAVLLLASTAFGAESPTVDWTGYRETKGAQARMDGDVLSLTWSMDGKARGRLRLDLRPGRPLIRDLATAAAHGPFETIASDLNPVILLTVGVRDLKKRGGWTIFFDRTPRKAHKTYAASLKKSSASVRTRGERVTITVGTISAGPFTGAFRFTVYPGANLVHVRAAMRSTQNGQAILYDAGVAGPLAQVRRVAWMGTDGALRLGDIDADAPAAPRAVRHRTILLESDAGTLALFPPPHRYFYPLDFSNNLKFVWQGRNYRGVVSGYGAGIRQALEGDRRFVPWFNAPPETVQELEIFYLLSRADASKAIEQVKRFTRGDRFAPLPGHVTFSSHYHVEHTLDLMNRRRRADRTFDVTKVPVEEIAVPDALRTPGFVRVFKAMGVDIVHLAEFHNGRTPRLSAAPRLAQLELMHRECRRLSDDKFLLLPGEEPNVHLGGHWISFFPRPVYWVLNNKGGKPYVEEHPRLGRVYHMGSSEDVLKLLKAEGGLAWTAHARIKSSTGYPDRYRNKPFYRSDRFLGAAWKAMPADLSRPRLGWRILDLLDDMANWGQEKYVLGEVDVFKVEPDHELYGHMNVNYLRLDAIPKFDDGWAPVLDALRGGRFFVTTGEVLIAHFTAGGKRSGERLRVGNGPVAVEARLQWTFPLAFAEIVSGDGANVYRQRIDLTDTRAFGKRTVRRNLSLAGRKWVRLEVWDVATNGAFTQPVWLTP